MNAPAIPIVYMPPSAVTPITIHVPILTRTPHSPLYQRRRQNLLSLTKDIQQLPFSIICKIINNQSSLFTPATTLDKMFDKKASRKRSSTTNVDDSINYWKGKAMKLEETSGTTYNTLSVIQQKNRELKNTIIKQQNFMNNYRSRQLRTHIYYKTRLSKIHRRVFLLNDTTQQWKKETLRLEAIIDHLDEQLLTLSNNTQN